jgi:hypothetical protein
MWGLAVGIYAVLKIVSWRSRRTSAVAPWKHVAYLGAWPGMDANEFLDPAPGSVARPGLTEWFIAFFKLMAGIALAWFAIDRLPTADAYLTGWIGMIGLVLALHFGLFHLLSCLWRGVDLGATPVMNAPLRASSLIEFWSRRWNLAFRDLTHRFLFRPLASRLGPSAALFAGFFMSGLIHDAVISLPAEGGYGRPTVYFVIQTLGIAAERSRAGRAIGLGRGLCGRIWTAAVLLAPVTLLFHRPFVVDVIVPFLETLGRTS